MAGAVTPNIPQKDRGQQSGKGWLANERPFDKRLTRAKKRLCQGGEGAAGLPDSIGPSRSGGSGPEIFALIAGQDQSTNIEHKLE
jgi:hypothetical protein